MKLSRRALITGGAGLLAAALPTACARASQPTLDICDHIHKLARTVFEQFAMAHRDVYLVTFKSGQALQTWKHTTLFHIKNEGPIESIYQVQYETWEYHHYTSDRLFMDRLYYRCKFAREAVMRKRVL